MPIRQPGHPAGDSFLITHCYASENREKYPGWWHAAEDWRLADRSESSGSDVLAITDGEVVYADYDYPGRVVILSHAGGLFSMYGHLDFALAIEAGARVAGGDVLGRVLQWPTPDTASHLHVEMRTFLLSDPINGDDPQYGVSCGIRCPPGPGYWPMIDGRTPGEMGWRNPTHVLGAGLGGVAPFTAQVASTAGGLILPLRSAPGVDADILRPVQLVTGERMRVIAVQAGDAATVETGALAYAFQMHVELATGEVGWLDAMVPDTRSLGVDGLPSAIRPVLLPIMDEA